MITARSEAFDAKKLASSIRPTVRMQLIAMFHELAFKLSEDQAFLDQFLSHQQVTINIQSAARGWDYQFEAVVDLGSNAMDYGQQVGPEDLDYEDLDYEDLD
ncbi:MAG: hypothetical protein ACXAB9_15835 [Candidatus Thorarchaeota archaeon]|jgi:hypothetical protein